MLSEGVAVVKSHWSFSGRYWSGWTATWAGLIAVVVAMPGAPDKLTTAATNQTHAQGVAKASTSATRVSVEMRRFDYGELPDTAFGDYDPSRDRR